MRYDLGDPSTETTLVVRPDLGGLTAGDLVQLGDLARHLDRAMKVELAFDDAAIEPNSYVLRDTSWQEYCPMPEMIRQSNWAGQEGAEQVRDHDHVPGHRVELGPPRPQPDARQRRGDDVRRELSLINKLYRALERHWIFYAVGRQIVTQNERKIGRKVTQAATAGARPAPS
jgi:hypothetical protein